MDASQPYMNDEQLSALEAEVLEFCDTAGQKRLRKEIDWRIARRFVAGDQWLKKVEVPGMAPDLQEVSLPGRMAKWKITANRLLPGMGTRLAHVLKSKPIGVVLPETQDEEDRNAARVADEVVEFDFRATDYEARMAEDAGPEMFTTGNVFLKWYWDPLAGKEVDVPVYAVDEATGEPQITPIEIPDPVSGQPVPNPDPNAGKAVTLEVKRQPQGEPRLDVVLPEELYVDPIAKNLDDCGMVVHEMLQPLDRMRRLAELWGVSEEDIEQIEPIRDEGWSAAVYSTARKAGYTKAELAARCEVREVWAKPNHDKGFPEGLWAVLINRKIFIAQPTLPGHDHIPFAHLKEIPLPGEFYGTSCVIQALPIQKALNLTLSRDEYRRTVQRPKLVADYEAGLQEEQLTNDDKELLEKNHGYTVEWLEAPTYESDPRASDRYIQLIDDIFGNVAILMGDAQGEVRSGRQMFMAGEYAGTALSGPARSIERANKRLGNGFLKLRKANTSEARDIQIVGKSRGIEVFQFRGSDLDGAGDYHVEAGSALPMSVAQKRQMVMELVDRQILPPDRALKLLPMPSDIDAEMDADRQDRDNATEENLRFMGLTEEAILQARQKIGAARQQIEQRAQQSLMAVPPPPGGLPPGELPGVEPFDEFGDLLEALQVEPRPEFENNLVHIEQHNKWRKTRAYRSLPKVIQALADEHCDRHMMAIVPPPMPGGPGGGPGEPPPPGGALPQGLMPGMPPRVGLGPDQAGDLGAGMPAMPPTPTSGDTLRGQ